MIHFIRTHSDDHLSVGALDITALSSQVSLGKYLDWGRGSNPRGSPDWQAILVKPLLAEQGSLHRATVVVTHRLGPVCGGLAQELME